MLNLDVKKCSPIKKGLTLTAQENRVKTLLASFTAGVLIGIAIGLWNIHTIHMAAGK